MDRGELNGREFFLTTLVILGVLVLGTSGRFCFAMPVVHAFPGRWETLLRPGPWPMMLPYGKNALAHVHAHAHAHTLAPLFL